jgi:hypothetical protein
MGEEISRLLAADFIKEIRHPNWIASPVLVPNRRRNWRICVDYTSLNKACQKDPFPLPRIDQVGDLTTKMVWQKNRHGFEAPTPSTCDGKV